jgi:peptidoglycan/LPS O-acetylase OafA/YrhL
VFFHHFFWASKANPLATTSIFMREVAAVARYGQHGVDVFFVLSGFLITCLLLVDRKLFDYFHSFYWKRALRILPVYFIHLILTQLMMGHARGYIVLGLLFVLNFGGRFGVSPGIAWTLSIEEQFYFIWPQCVRRMRMPALYYVAFTLAITSILLRLIVPMLKGSMATTYTFYRCDGLCLGAILACQWFSTSGQTRTIRTILSVLNSNVTLLLFVSLQIFTVARLADGPIALSCTITCVNYFTYRLLSRLISERKSPVLTWLGRSVPVFFGRISYSMYMFQGFVFFLWERHFGEIDPTRGAATLARLVASLFITIVLCTASLYLIELPVQKLRSLVLRRARVPEMAIS